MNIKNSKLVSLEDWQKGILVVIIGVPIGLLGVAIISSILISNASQPLALTGIAFFLLIFGIIGGYVAKHDYFKTFEYTIFLAYLIIFCFLFIFIDGIELILNWNSSSIRDLLILLTSNLIWSFMISVGISIFLLPSLFIGSRLRKD